MQANKGLLKQLIQAIDNNKVGPKRRKFYGRPFYMWPWPVSFVWLMDLDRDFNQKTSIHFSELFNGKEWTFVEIATLLELVYIHKILD